MSAFWQNPQKGYTWWWLILAETCSVYVATEQNKNIEIVARGTEVHYLFISEHHFFSYFVFKSLSTIKSVHCVYKHCSSKISSPPHGPPNTTYGFLENCSIFYYILLRCGDRALNKNG
jgi:hypothetical protein